VEGNLAASLCTLSIAAIAGAPKFDSLLQIMARAKKFVTADSSCTFRRLQLHALEGQMISVYRHIWISLSGTYNALATHQRRLFTV